MSKRYRMRAASFRGLSGCLSVGLLVIGIAGCAGNRPEVQMSSPELTAYVQLIMPKKIEIQPYWTKPVSFAGDGDADGLEVILAAYDSFGDLTKIVGTLHFELYTRRMASADRREKRVAFWQVELNSRETLMQYWDPLARFYRFHLRLTEGPAPPGRYILCARLMAPDRELLFDEYEFTYEPGTAAPVSLAP